MQSICLNQWINSHVKSWLRLGAFKGSEENEHKLTTGRLKFINVKTIWTPNWKMNWFLLLLGATDPLELKIMTPATTHFLELSSRPYSPLTMNSLIVQPEAKPAK